MSRTDIEETLQRVSKQLGGGWRIENDVMPLIVLTLPEAPEA